MKPRNGADRLAAQRQETAKKAKAQAKADARTARAQERAAQRAARAQRKAWERSGGAPVRIDVEAEEQDLTQSMGIRRRLAERRAEMAAEARSKPGPRGWTGRGGGRAAWIDPVPEYRGTSVQVCGLWPFSAGSGTPVVGAPLGQHLETGATVCADPVSWYLNGLVTQPSAFVLGRPGLGKSTLVRHMITVMCAWGITPLVLSDLKPDYVDLIGQLDGQHIRVGRGLPTINPLDTGPLGRLVDQLEGDLRRETIAQVHGRQLNVLLGLLELVRGTPLEAHERTLLTEALRMVNEADLRDATGAPRMPLVSDVEELVRARPERLARLAQDRNDVMRYQDRTEALIDSLAALGEAGPFGSTFCSPTTVSVDTTRPLVFDMSSVDETDVMMQAALQLLCWSFGQGLAQTSAVQARAGLGPRRIYVLVMDELWRMLRASDLMIDRVDALTRLNRQLGLGQLMITHTMNDLKMSTDELTARASGFVERSALVFLGGLSNKEMGNLSTVFAMSSTEENMVTGWADEGGISEAALSRQEAPGLGKFLLKMGPRPGVPFRVVLSNIELSGGAHDTNKAFADLKAARGRHQHNGYEVEEDPA